MSRSHLNSSVQPTSLYAPVSQTSFLPPYQPHSATLSPIAPVPPSSSKVTAATLKLWTLTTISPTQWVGSQPSHLSTSQTTPPSFPPYVKSRIFVNSTLVVKSSTLYPSVQDQLKFCSITMVNFSSFSALMVFLLLTSFISLLDNLMLLLVAKSDNMLLSALRCQSMMRARRISWLAILVIVPRVKLSAIGLGSMRVLSRKAFKSWSFLSRCVRSVISFSLN
ncbi:hypothetical protein FOMG_19113 [Fusarium oxysporum f. sp. melonis 26406]|uniref:Uncharacterized protein n=1 Tax=Fusarium oxysporum f. sp. melonis 26406 TaxID=1089452 RepID=W9ZSS9_FUSOX|nr:hypothetical protein FOMG_19113 [Fusarium oxysporum f. sp. melonis 26406]